MLTGGDRGRAWIELDRAALENNVKVLRDLLPPGCGLMPAVKADAYGHGAALVAGALREMGIEDFCTATAAEGVALRQAGVRGHILVLGYTGPEDRARLAALGLTQTVTCPEHAQALRGRETVSVHIAIDTGLHRLGTAWDDGPGLRSIYGQPGLRVTGAYTHLAGAGEAFDREQIRRFYTAVEGLRQGGCPVGKVHLLASGGILRYPEAAGDWARPGIALYGTLETAEATAACPAALRPVLSLKGRITAIHRLAPGVGAGYGLAFTAGRETVLAAAALGYADGLPRQLGGGRGRALVRGRSALIAGRICMDQCLLDVTDVPGAAVGDEAVFIGRSGGETIHVCELAGAAGTIANEILSRLGPRLERRFAP